MIRPLAACFAALLTFGASASAQTAIEPARPLLKPEALVTGGLVRIGDLIDHAGVVANVPIFRAPDLGATGTVPADAVIEAVRAHALVGLDTGGVSEVVVTRASRAIPVEDIETSVAQALSLRFNLGDVKDIAVSFERDPRVIHVEPNAKGEPRVARLTYDARSGRFDAMLDIPTGAVTHGTLRLAGRAVATADLVTVSHTIERGMVLRESDVVIERRPRSEIARDIITDRDQAIGLAARMPLRPGQPLRSAQLMKPELVQRNETVTLIHEVPGITLTVRGKAMESGAEGDSIAVLNEQSKRTVHGIVIGPGRVMVSVGTPRLAANVASTQPEPSVKR